MTITRFKLAQIAALAAHRPAGYYEAVLAAGRLVKDSVELTAEALQELRARYQPEPSPDWPLWALLAGVWFRAPQDRGVGDTIKRELGGGKTEAFKRHHELVFGVWEKPCSCAGQVARWNALYPYGRVEGEAIVG